MSAIQATDEIFDPFVLIHQSVTARLQTVEAELETAEQKSRDLEASLERVRDLAGVPSRRKAPAQQPQAVLAVGGPGDVRQHSGNTAQRGTGADRVRGACQPPRRAQGPGPVPAFGQSDPGRPAADVRRKWRPSAPGRWRQAVP